MDRKIEIDPSAGVCYGVEKAIATAEEKLGEGKQVYGLGDMVHNHQETQRLAQLGLKTISVSDLDRIGPARVILRAHGEPPSTYDRAAANHVELIDATCPIVISLQKKIRKRYEALNKHKEQIVIFGKKDHPETIGLMGQTNNEAVLVTEPGAIDQVDPGKKVYLYSQTTMDPDEFDTLQQNIEALALDGAAERPASDCSICNQMKRRKPDLKKFALSHDHILFVSGKNSSNGAMLYDYCKKLNNRSYWIHADEDIDPEWFSTGGSIGISGATSTPVWQLEKVKQYLVSLTID
jgi:4-hydroxy-3-methylbut-2-enyl diphosphate reductase